MIWAQEFTCILVVEEKVENTENSIKEIKMINNPITQI